MGILIISGVISLGIIILVLRIFTSPKLSNTKENSVFLNSFKFIASNLSFKQKALDAKYLVIGTISYPENYLPLKNYLSNQFGNEVQIVIDGGEETSYQAAKNKIAEKKWDIVFTASPMISVAAKDNGYIWVARMFAYNPPFYQSALFVKANSHIQSLNDLNSTTKIALGDFNSASSFYMPSYDLYGKTLRVEMGNKGNKIREMVEKGEVDVGTGAYEVVKSNPNLRVIHISRNIPAAGVYLSPNLSSSDLKRIQQALIEAPDDVKQKDKANYDRGEEPDYSSFLKITSRVDEVINCADFTKNPVDFFCLDTKNDKMNNLQIKISTITGTVNGVTKIDLNTVRLIFESNNKKIYQVFISPQILNQIPNAGSVFNLQGKKIKIVDVIPKKDSDKTEKLNINYASQLKIINDQ